MCDASLEKPEQSAEAFSADGSFIIEKNVMRVPSSFVYPRVNLYYAFTEDIHPMTRIAVARGFSPEKEKFLPRYESFEERFIVPYSPSRDEATNHYLETDPPSFVVFGKPGLNNADVALSVADSWNCVLISPLMLIQREIEIGTEEGRDIEETLKLGGNIRPEIVMNLMQRRIRMRDVKHRGYVVEGLPLIPNEARFDRLSHSSHAADVGRSRVEFCEGAACTTYEQPITACGGRDSTDNYSSCPVGIEREITRQISEMFTTWSMKPLIIIYIVCPKRDVASRRAGRRVETANIVNNVIATQLSKPEDDESDGSVDLTEFSEVTREWSTNANNARKSYSLRRIFDVKCNVELQCDLYERLALPVIDKCILAHDPCRVIRVDGRSSARRVLQIINARLRVLPLQPPILPERMIKQDEVGFSSGQINLSMNTSDELANKTVEEVFEVLRRKDIISPEFPWRLSTWKFHCPVKLAQGRTVKGLAEYSVLFLSKIFFLSSRETMNLFVENPRTFLSAPNPRPTCKIAVFGPKYAGKSYLSLRLAEAFGGTAINVNEITKKLIERRAGEVASDTIDEIDADKKNRRVQEFPIQEPYENDLDEQLLLSRAKRIYGKPVDMSIYEKADVIIRNIEEIPNVELEDGLQRDGGYIVDGMYADIEIWKIIYDANIIFEDVVVLYEDEPYARLFNKFDSFPDSSIYREEYKSTETDNEKYEISGGDVEWDYLEHLKQFESEWARFEGQFSDFEGNVMRCNLADIEDVPEYVINYLKRRFQTTTTITSVDDKEMETLEKKPATVQGGNTELAEERIEKDEREYSTQTIDLETAERLLACGYYFFSPFGRWCPVQVYTNKVPIQMFLPMEARGQIFPIVYRSYVYFLAGEEARSTFVSDPAKYVAQLRPCSPPFPLRISIVGPPKCGKTTLAGRFAREYGMKVITRGKALRHMLKYYSWTESARMTEDQLREGHATSIDSVIRALEMLSLGARATSQGYVLDDCPSNREEAEQLISLGMQPMIVLDLQADLPFCLECLSHGSDNGARRPPNFSASFLLRRYANWQAHQASFRDWLKMFSRNVVELDATNCKWNVWDRADRAVRSRFADILLYHSEAKLDKAHRLEHMCVSPFEFRSRQSQYESYCPICLLSENTVKLSDQPTYSRGIIQFREYFYWICSRHINSFVRNPLRYLPPVNTASLPVERPRTVKEIVDVKRVFWAQRLQLGGLCLVTYVDGLPERKLSQGRTDLAVLLGDKAYLFCRESCRERFLAQYDKYRKKIETFRRDLAPVDLRYLPNVDFLRKTVMKAVLGAMERVAAQRPKIAGLSAAVSAAIHIGVYLKIHNVSGDLHEVDLYESASQRMAEQNRTVKIATKTMKKNLNPYVSLPKRATSNA